MAILSKPTTDLMLLSFKKVTPIINQVSNYAQTAVKSTNALLNKYPPLKAFVYTLVSASAVPVACFSGYVAMTGGGVLAVASTGAAMVQAGFMAFGAFAVSWFLLGAFILASVLTFWFTLAWVAFQLAKKLEGKEINFKIIS